MKRYFVSKDKLSFKLLFGIMILNSLMKKDSNTNFLAKITQI